MKIETTPRDDHQVTLTVEVENERLESARRRAARRISERKTIPGFRPGKAPYEYVVRHVGEAAVTEEAIDLLLDELYPQVLDEAKIEAGAPGTLEKVEGLAEKHPVFTFNVPLAPVVDLGDYRAVRLPYDWQPPGDEQVEAAMQELRRLYAKTETVTRPIEKGDFVLIELKGLKAGAATDEPPVIEQRSMPVFVRPEPGEDEWPFPGFAHQLIGLQTGESKTLSHTFPKDHADEKLHGAKVDFEVTVKMVRATILPDLNDEFARAAGPFENLEALRDVVRADLAEKMKAEYDDDYFEQVLEKIRAGASIKYPPQILESEMGEVLADLQARLAEQNMDLETYFKMRETTREKFIEEQVRPIAVKRLERALVLDEVIRREKIEVSKEALEASFKRTLDAYAASGELQRRMGNKSKPSQQLIDALARRSFDQAMVEQTLARLKEIATGSAPAVETEQPAPKSRAAKKAGGEKKAAAQKTGRGSAGKAKKAAAEADSSTSIPS
ncbi:MAG: trigger factor [Anaerolineales bacterium]